MSVAIQTARPKPGARTKPDRRRYFRVGLNLGGRFMFDSADHTFETVDVSCGGARITASTLPPEGQTIVCYFDDLGRVMARVIRHVTDGFAIAFEIGAHKRDKLADRLVWIVNHKSLDIDDERDAPRKAVGGPALVTRANGTRIQCRVIDISLTGAAFEHQGAVLLVGEHVRAGSITGEVVRSVTNEFAIRFLHRGAPTPNEPVT